MAIPEAVKPATSRKLENESVKFREDSSVNNPQLKFRLSLHQFYEKLNVSLEEKGISLCFNRAGMGRM